MVTYPAMMVLGVPIHLLLVKRGWTSGWVYTLAGLVIGAIIGGVLFGRGVAILGAILGPAMSFAFWVITRPHNDPERRPMNGQGGWTHRTLHPAWTPIRKRPGLLRQARYAHPLTRLTPRFIVGVGVTGEPGSKTARWRPGIRPPGRPPYDGEPRAPQPLLRGPTTRRFRHPTAGTHRQHAHVPDFRRTIPYEWSQSFGRIRIAWFL